MARSPTASGQVTLDHKLLGIVASEGFFPLLVPSALLCLNGFSPSSAPSHSLKDIHLRLILNCLWVFGHCNKLETCPGCDPSDSRDRAQKPTVTPSAETQCSKKTKQTAKDFSFSDVMLNVKINCVFSCIGQWWHYVMLHAVETPQWSERRSQAKSLCVLKEVEKVPLTLLSRAATSRA